MNEIAVAVKDEAGAERTARWVALMTELWSLDQDEYLRVLRAAEGLIAAAQISHSNKST
jgi:hypothetical protein